MLRKGIGVRVLIGIICGIGLGLLLIQFAPVGLQPQDKLAATTTTGETLTVSVPEGIKPGRLRINGEDTGETRNWAGTPMSEMPAAIGEASGIPISSVDLVERKSVSARPVITEIVYVGGELFLRLLRMLVVPLIIATVLVGIASLSNIRQLGKLGATTAVVYVSTMLIAAAVGVFYVDMLRPGDPLRERWASEATDIAIADQTPSELILRVIPTNPFEAIVNLDIIGILFFTILLAFAILSLGKKRSAPVFNFFQSLNDLMFVLIGWVMWLAPFGVGMLIAHTIGTQDVAFLSDLLAGLAKFAATVTVGLVTHFIILLAIVGTLGKYNPITFVKKLGPAMAVAFGTNSSTATLPVTMKCVDDMDVSRRIRNFVVPVGATLNMDGTALFEAVTVIFFAQAFGFDLSFGQTFLIAILAVVAAMGAAGIPSAGLVTMVIVLSAVGLPATKIATIFAIDRPLDMMRTIVNITGDAMTSRVVQARFPDIRKEDDDLAEEYERVEPSLSRGE